MLEQSTEKQYLHALMCDDEKAFTLLYNEYWQMLFGVAYNTTNSRAVAQEIVQEVFVSLWVNRKTLQIQTTVKAYLYGAIRNKVFDYFDKQKVRDNYKSKMALQTSIAINSTEEQVEFEEINTLVNHHIENLPETTRKIFILSRFRGFSIPEISTELSLSVKAVEYHLTKALKFLRLRLANYTSGPTELLTIVLVLLSNIL